MKWNILFNAEAQRTQRKRRENKWSSLRFLCVLCASALITQPLYTQTDEAFIGNRAKYWAFQKVVRPPVPATHNPWIHNPIDAFILDSLQQKHISPSPALDR